MTQTEQFQKLLKPDNLQVFLMICPGNIPFNFARHPFFVVNKRGVLSRWELLFRWDKQEPDWGHIHLNFLPPFQGIGVFPFQKKFYWKADSIGSVEGEEDSTAKQIIDFLEKSPYTYPFRNHFFLTGPNSNTYVQWVLDHFPEFNVKLPWNSFGKDYKAS